MSHEKSKVANDLRVPSLSLSLWALGDRPVPFVKLHTSRLKTNCSILVVLSLLFLNTLRTYADTYHDTVAPFLEEYCIQCHGPEKQKGDRRYDNLKSDFLDKDALILWQDIADLLNLGDMPPEEETQPSPDDRQAVINWITDELTIAYEHHKSSDRKTVLRRLNRYEYNRTVRDLLHLQPLLIDPTESFPPDETEENFNNIGSALITSDFLLQGYLDAAESYIEQATRQGPEPEVQSYQFPAPFYTAGNRWDGKDVAGEFQHIRKNTTDQDGFLWLEKLEQGVPESGYYKLRFKAQAINREYPYPERIVGTRKSEPLRVDVIAGSREYGELESRTSSDRKVADFIIADESSEWYESRIWLDKGFQPRLTFPNGPNRVKPIRKTLVRNYPDHFQEFIHNWTIPGDGLYPYPIEEAEARRIEAEAQKIATVVGRVLDTQGTSNKFNRRDGWAAFYRGYEGPRIRVFEIELEGPYFEDWPTPSYRALFGDKEPTMENARPILERFADAAFRRPADDAKIDVLHELVLSSHQSGKSAFESLKIGFRAILCSPDFIYLQEPEGRLDDYALASRLSYFLWSTQPDQTLRELAKAGALSRPDVLKAQVLRMLDDKRSQAFTEQFTSRWLELYKIGTMPPSDKEFMSYYVDGLEGSMKRETQTFFRYILENNLPISSFLDSDFTFVDGGLARLYGINGVTGPAMQKVSLASFPQRGGLLGQASILTASANGIDTSPIIRGIWILDNILGAPPAPPPPDVEPLEPDIRGSTTIRDQLDKHRELEACYECHRKIDPLGFALENFDPIGGWRDHYPRGNSKGPLIDASGQLPNGDQFSDIKAFKSVLANRQEQFAHCLTEKLLAYSMGRTIEFTDRPEVDHLVEQLSDSGSGLRDLVIQITQSEAFLTK